MTQIEEAGTDENSPMEGSVAKPARITIKELNQLIADVQEYPLQNDDKWFVVSYTWWSKVLETVKQGYVEDIPSIDNGSISDKSSDGYFLRANLAESIDFHLLPEPVFSRLRDVYGVEIEERDFIPRFVIEKAGKLVVEVYPRLVMVSFAADSSRFCVLRLQGSDTMVDLRDRALRELGLIDTPIDRMKFYISHGDKYELIDTSQQNLDNYFDTAQKVNFYIQSNKYRSQHLHLVHYQLLRCLLMLRMRTENGLSIMINQSYLVEVRRIRCMWFTESWKYLFHGISFAGDILVFFNFFIIIL
uniref:DUSP domain-containing protein n=1 Tax=Heterorhabditis bacteriophora TaxID=37862 RepID=A0A1I7X9N3_HETBA